MKVIIGAVLVLLGTVRVVTSANLDRPDTIGVTEREILGVIAGLTGFVIVILGWIDSPPTQRGNSALVAGVLVPPTWFLCTIGARLISLGWFSTDKTYWLGVLGVVLAFTLLALLAATILWLVVSWIRRARR